MSSRPTADGDQGAKIAVQLLVSEWCPTCPNAEAVWRQVAAEKDIRFAVVDVAQPEGRELASRLRLKTVPSVVIDRKLAAVGVQSLAEARALVAAAPDRPKGRAYHAGMMLSPDNRAFVVSSMGYLMLSGLVLLVQGTLLGEGMTRPAVVHLFGAGVVLMLIYGLGAHMLPRFTGNPIRGGVLAWLQLASAHVGVLGQVGGFYAGARAWAEVGSVALFLSLALFAGRLWPVLWSAAGGEDPQRRRSR
ncbi:thioredoxin family protein [Pelomicrobium methylotrophicum]|uniref:thioredoxin family protein n=1 Tax=Pelomicrobium methylotrophicum TaxID=2602750 RepID=UPI001969EBC7|nr:thioredoxin family protein [Pelomicrobium methylotrophicum]